MIFNQNEPFTTKQDNKPNHETIIVEFYNQSMKKKSKPNNQEFFKVSHLCDT